MRTRMIVSALAASALVSLNACTANTPRPSPTPTASASAPAAAECVDGVAALQADDQQSKHDGCDVFDVLGNGNTLTVGDVKQLTVEGDHNTITVHTVDTVTSSGTDNTIYYDGDEPDFNELGSGSKVLPSSAR
ncbi:MULTISPECIES: DUF3060 domain-containing protein [unclassified Curtobacterium]|uniref:DUF3060 domain-containing protein n=1 Tax=unclassified Curtobacterium TaxID=257496 RepID=UPI0027863F58|nr:DUF3060 domain-containing protein [Curtobacterium sp. 260]MDP9737177.1 flagellar basal body L-ring protein FlgH [Curtobacterium sp. 260]